MPRKYLTEALNNYKDHLLKGCGIYLITNPNGEKYVGATKNLEQRFNDYKRIYRVICQKDLYNSLLKFGISAHTIEVLEYCNISEKDDLEKYYIKKFDCVENGLNRSFGGRGVNSPRTEEWIKNNSESVKKPILQYDLNGNFIKEWKSAKDVEIELGFDRKNISSNLRRVTHKAYEYIWVFKGEDLLITKKKTRGKKVLDTENNIIYNNISAASDATGLKYSTLRAMLCGIFKNKTKLIYV